MWDVAKFLRSPLLIGLVGLGSGLMLPFLPNFAHQPSPKRGQVDFEISIAYHSVDKREPTRHEFSPDENHVTTL